MIHHLAILGIVGFSAGVFVGILKEVRRYRRDR